MLKVQFEKEILFFACFARTIDGELVADEIVGNIDAYVTGDGVFIEIVLVLSLN